MRIKSQQRYLSAIIEPIFNPTLKSFFTLINQWINIYLLR